MTTKHWAEDSIKKTIPLAGIPGEKIEYVNPQKVEKMTSQDKAAKRHAEKSARLAQGSFAFESMSEEAISEMNEFLDEKIKSLGTHSDDKEEAEDVNLIKKMVKKPALKSSVMESFIVDELSFIQTSPITTSLAESIAMVMGSKEVIESDTPYHKLLDHLSGNDKEKALSALTHKNSDKGTRRQGLENPYHPEVRQTALKMILDDPDSTMKERNSARDMASVKR